MIENKKFSVSLTSLSEPAMPVRSKLDDYKVQFFSERSGLEQINRLLTEAGVFLVADKKVYELYGDRLRVPSGRVLLVRAGERLKTLRGVDRIFAFLNENNFTRRNRLIVLGGGTVQDSAGFAAACYKRGVKWIFVPTTLLSMCDSCIGAKTGINYGRAKNQLGVFYAPARIIIDVAFLETLPASMLRSGMGEILKLAVMGGPVSLDLYRMVSAAAMGGDSAAMLKLVRQSLLLKRSVIEADEFEADLRKALNYGHTAGHALEVLSNYKIPHGIAVAMGMAVANTIAAEKALITPEYCDEINSLCSELGTRGMAEFPLTELLPIMKKDKKADKNSLVFALPIGPGRMSLLPVKAEAALVRTVKKVLKKYF